MQYTILGKSRLRSSRKELPTSIDKYGVRLKTPNDASFQSLPPREKLRELHKRLAEEKLANEIFTKEENKFALVRTQNRIRQYEWQITYLTKELQQSAAFSPVPPLLTSYAVGQAQPSNAPLAPPVRVLPLSLLTSATPRWAVLNIKNATFHLYQAIQNYRAAPSIARWIVLSTLNYSVREAIRESLGLDINDQPRAATTANVTLYFEYNKLKAANAFHIVKVIQPMVTTEDHAPQSRPIP